MKRVVGVVLWLALLLGVMLWPAISYDWSTAAATYEETTIRKYVADFTVDDDGDLHATETLTVDFPGYGKHGIFRFFDEADQSATNARREPYDISVTRDGSPEPFELLDENNGTVTNVQDRLRRRHDRPAGEHTYVIDYTIDGVLEEGTTGQTDPVLLEPDPRRLAAADRRRRPSPCTCRWRPSGVQCARGAGQTGGCTAEGDGTETLTVDVEALVAEHAGHGQDRPRHAHARRRAPACRGRRASTRSSAAASPACCWSWLLAAARPARSARGRRARSREKTPAFPLHVRAARRHRPGAGRVHLHRDAPARRTFVASIMQAAEKGAINLDRSGDSWTDHRQGQGPQGWAGLDSVTQRVAQLLGGPGLAVHREPEQRQRRREAEERAGRVRVRDPLVGDLRAGFMQTAGLGCLGGLFVIGGGILALLIAVGNLFDMGIVALIPGMLAAGAAPVLASGASTRRTATGRDLWSRVGGFRRMLATPSSKNRFDFSGRKELYTAYIPWAVAFDCADEWAAKYRIETGEEPPVPSYFAGAYAGAHAGTYVDSMVDDFS